jgi:hypothetical protein
LDLNTVHRTLFANYLPFIAPCLEIICRSSHPVWKLFAVHRTLFANERFRLPLNKERIAVLAIKY